MRLAIAIPRIIAENLVIEHNKRRGVSGRERREAIGIRFPATPAIGIGARLPSSGFGIRLHGLAIRPDDAYYRLSSIAPNLVPDFQCRERNSVFLEMSVVFGIDQYPFAEFVDPNLINAVMAAVVFQSRSTT